MGRLNYRKYIACRHGWVNQSLAKEHIQYVRIMLREYPIPEA